MGLQPAASPENLLEVQILRVTESETLGTERDSTLWYNEYCKLMFENH